ncbi:integrase catalytic domain-containing protein [Flagellimonas lutimaris]|nr:DDE-type integrase/transposase/recombinase [Allomuricauda lutimaris]
MSDSLVHGRRFRTFDIIDDFNRKAICVEAKFSFPAVDGVQVLRKAIVEHGGLDVSVDNGPGFISLHFTRWCGAQGTEIQYTQPGSSHAEKVY